MKLTRFNFAQKLGIQLKPTTMAVINELIKFTNDQAFCFPSEKTLADRLHISRHTVMRHIKIIKEIQIGRHSLPFVAIYKTRSNKGKYQHNRYFFPWLVQSDLYIKEHHTTILSAEINRMRDLSYEEYFSEDHVAKSDSNCYDRVLSSNYAQELTSNLKTDLKLPAEKILITLLNVAREIDNGTVIWHLPKYLKTAFKATSEQNIFTKAMQFINKPFAGVSLHEQFLNNYI